MIVRSYEMRYLLEHQDHGLVNALISDIPVGDRRVVLRMIGMRQANSKDDFPMMGLLCNQVG